MHSTMTKTEPSKRAQERLIELGIKIRTHEITQRFWNSKLLNERNRGCLLAEAGAENEPKEFQIAMLRQHFGSAARMLQKVGDVSQTRAILDVARHTDLLTEDQHHDLLGKCGELLDPERAREDAIFRGDLVLTRSPKTVYWQGELIEGDWDGSHGEAWAFILTACEHALEKKDIERDSFGENAREGVVKDKKHKLKKVPGFPPELIANFKIVGNGAQRFTFPHGQIRIFDND